MKPTSSRQLRRVTLLLGCVLVLYCLFFLSTNGSGGSTWRTGSLKKVPEDLLQDLFLDESQCEATFPGLTKDIHDTLSEGPFKVKQTGNLGPLQGRIKDGRVSKTQAEEQETRSRANLTSST